MTTFLLFSKLKLHRTGSWSIPPSLCVWREKGWSTSWTECAFCFLFFLFLKLCQWNHSWLTFCSSVLYLVLVVVVVIVVSGGVLLWPFLVHCYVAVWQVNWLDNGGIGEEVLEERPTCKPYRLARTHTRPRRQLVQPVNCNCNSFAAYRLQLRSELIITLQHRFSQTF